MTQTIELKQEPWTGWYTCTDPQAVAAAQGHLPCMYQPDGETFVCLPGSLRKLYENAAAAAGLELKWPD